MKEGHDEFKSALKVQKYKMKEDEKINSIDD